MLFRSPERAADPETVPVRRRAERRIASSRPAMSAQDRASSQFPRAPLARPGNAAPPPTLERGDPQPGNQSAGGCGKSLGNGSPRLGRSAPSQRDFRVRIERFQSFAARFPSRVRAASDGKFGRHGPGAALATSHRTCSERGFRDDGEVDSRIALRL